MPGSRKYYTLLFDSKPTTIGTLGSVSLAYDAVYDVLTILGIQDDHILSLALTLKQQGGKKNGSKNAPPLG